MYQILLEGHRVKRNQVTGMHLMAGFLLVVMGVVTWLVPNSLKQQRFDFLNWVGLAYALFGFALLIACTFFNRKMTRTKANFTLRILEALALAPIVIYSLLHKWYLPAAYSAAALLGIAFAFYWEKAGKQSRLAIFDDDGVQLPRLGKKDKILWQDITRVLLRHNILTVDCKNNKLFQLTTEKKEPSINKEAFEAYCKMQAEAKSHLYKATW